MEATEVGSGVKLQSGYLDYLPAIYRRELKLDPGPRKVWVAGERVSVGEQEFDLLAYLYQRQSTTCSEDEIAANVKLGLAENEAASRDTVSKTIERIRQAIERDPARPHYLKTMNGAGYRLDTDEFMGRFLLIFENVLKPIQEMVDDVAFYFDPLTAPKAMLPWLASWVDFVLDPTWPEQKRRELVKKAAELYRWRGTRRGLAEYLSIYTGSVPEISEQMAGMRLGPDATLGHGTQLGSHGGGCHFIVTVELDESSPVSDDCIKSIIESEKPAHTVYTLHVERRRKSEVEDSDGTKRDH